MNGPFFTLRPISVSLGGGRWTVDGGSAALSRAPPSAQLPPLLSCLAALSSAHDQALRRLLLVARLHAFLLAPRANDVASAARTATVRVVDRVHDFAAHLRTLAHPAARAGLTQRLQLVLFVADDADRRHALVVHQAHFGGRHAQRH